MIFKLIQKNLSTQNEELKNSVEQMSIQIAKYKKMELSLQSKVHELSVKVQELEKLKIAFMLNPVEISSVVKES